MSESNELDILAQEYGSDKSSKLHFYTNIYNKLFFNKKFNQMNILEIGIAAGASLKMWADYFPRSNIYGIDIDPDCRKIKFQSNVKTAIGNAINPEFIKIITSQVNNFDIIIDDGSHVLSDIEKAFHLLFPFLNPGGTYIIEDTFASYSEGIFNFYNFIINSISLPEFIKSKKDNSWIYSNRKKIINESYPDEYPNDELGYLNSIKRNIHSCHIERGVIIIEKSNY